MSGPPPIPAGLSTAFVGERKPLFWLAAKTGLFTILTLGFYRFWMKTRLRRWYWSSVRPGGLPLEYVGDPLEKLLGFLIVVVFLAFYIGIANLILMFVSLSLLASNVTAYLVSFLAVIPLWFFARYRRRRYVLARTRWRGVRFGMLPGAWGYAARAMWHWTITILTLGILWPRMTFALEKYRTDRTVFGSATLHQGGHWTMLMPSYVHVLIGLFLTAVATIELFNDRFVFAWLYAVSLPWLIAGAVYFRVTSLRLMADHKTADGLTFTARPKIGTIARILTFGYTATLIVVLLPLTPIVTIVGLVESERMRGQWNPDAAGDIYGLPVWVWTILGVVAYFSVFLMWSVLRHCFVTMPLWRHIAETLRIENPEALSGFSQRARDEFAEAEGFAEALDIGADI